MASALDKEGFGVQTMGQDRPPAPLSRRHPVGALYVDNVNLLSAHPTSGRRAFFAIERALPDRGGGGSELCPQVLADYQPRLRGRFPQPFRAGRIVEEKPERIPPLDDHLLVPGRWGVLVAGATARADPMHMHEARIALCGLRVAAGRLACHRRLILSLGDTQGEVLAHEKGRASNRALNASSRRASALQCVSGIVWGRRYVETKRNHSDGASR